MLFILPLSSFFFFNDTATTEIYTLSLHDALPISFLGSTKPNKRNGERASRPSSKVSRYSVSSALAVRSEEHTSELQSRLHLVCRLLLEKKKKNQTKYQLRSQIQAKASRQSTRPNP